MESLELGHQRILAGRCDRQSSDTFHFQTGLTDSQRIQSALKDFRPKLGAPDSERVDDVAAALLDHLDHRIFQPFGVAEDTPPVR